MELCLSRQPESADRPWTTACLAIAAISLGVAIHIRDGLVEPRAIAWLLFAAGFMFAAFARLPRIQSISGRQLTKILVVGIAAEFALLLTYRLPDAWHAGHSAWPYYVLISAAGLLVAGLLISPRCESLIFVAILTLFAVTGLWLLYVSAKQKMDVWVSQTAGLQSLLHGASPWTSTFPDVYGIPDLYAPGTVQNGIVHLGFPYPPLTVVLDLPGHLTGGDFRYSNLFATVLAAAFIGYARPGRLPKLAAILFLFTPRAFLVLRNGWTEPQLAMLLSATVFCACRAPRALPYALGLLLASKQYMFVAVAPSLMLMGSSRSDAKGFYFRVIATAAAVSLPLALWNLPAYWHANFAAAASAKFRYDALSFFAYWANIYDWTPPGWIGLVSLVAIVPVTAFVLRRAPRSPAGFAAATAAAFLTFFSLNKFAFCNYYYFVISACCTAVASAMPAAVTTVADSPEIEPDTPPLRLAA